MYDGIKLFLEWVGYFFIAYLIGYSTFLFLSVVVGSLELYKHRRQEMFKSILPSDYYLPISIIVPAYNEEVTVADTVRSLLTLEYRAYEIIVVDDGSKDRTSEVLAETFDMHLVHRPIRRQINCQREEYVYETRAQKVPVTLIRKKNGGKADALNMGINAANFPYFICMDADSVLQYDSLRRIAQPVLEDGKVVAVGGIVRISNDVELENGRVKRYRLPRSILAFMQVLEYDRSFLASRILFDRFNGSLIISGAFGLFKKDTVIAAGGYDSGTMGEDMELVVKLHEYCTINGIDYAIRYASDAICWTQAPERLRDLCKQRKRWHLGLFQSMYKHRVMFSNYRFGAVSFVSYLYFLIYELLSPFIEIFGVFTMVLAWWFDLINVPFMLLFFLIYAVFGSVLTLLWLSCNFTRQSIADEKILARVREIVEQYDFTRDCLVVELTEDSYAHDREAALQTIEGLHAMGLRIVLDDIGAGYSSLSDLSTYPIDGVKIDRSIVIESALPRARALLEGMIRLSHDMGIRVLCEGVEDKATCDAVLAAGCDFIQGFYFSRVLPGREAESFLRSLAARDRGEG